MRARGHVREQHAVRRRGARPEERRPFEELHLGDRAVAVARAEHADKLVSLRRAISSRALP